MISYQRPGLLRYSRQTLAVRARRTLQSHTVVVGQGLRFDGKCSQASNKSARHIMEYIRRATETCAQRQLYHTPRLSATNVATRMLKHPSSGWCGSSDPITKANYTWIAISLSVQGQALAYDLIGSKGFAESAETFKGTSSFFSAMHAASR